MLMLANWPFTLSCEPVEQSKGETAVKRLRQAQPERYLFASLVILRIAVAGFKPCPLGHKDDTIQLDKGKIRLMSFPTWNRQDCPEP